MGYLLSLKIFPQISVDCGSTEISKLKGQPFLFVIDSLLHVMNISLPVESAPNVIIAFDESRERPTCLRQSRLIILTTPHSQWNRLAYQLSHEMCHMLIANDVPENLRWLEESICELSSYYFLSKLSKYWRRKKCNFVSAATKKPYYTEFETYVKNDSRKATPFDLSVFTSDDQSSDLSELIKNCELRNRNAHVANCMLPIFNKHPDTWHAVPYLCYIPPNLSLQDSLKEWIALSPLESRTGLEKISNLFGLSVPPDLPSIRRME